MQKCIQLQENDAICSIHIDRPKQLNSINQQVLQELITAIAYISNRNDIKVVLISGEGTKAFVAGADITEMLSMTPAEAQQFSAVGQNIFSMLETMPQPVIAVVNGFALGGGCELALACDIRIAADTARFGQPEVGLGIIPGFGGTQRLVRLVGPGKAKHLIYSGEIINAEEAYRMGLVDLVVPGSDLQDKAWELAEKIAKNSAYAVAQAKKSIALGFDVGLSAGLAYEAQAFGLCFTMEDQQNRMQSFVDKKK